MNIEEAIRKLNGTKQKVMVEIDPAEIQTVKNFGDFCKLIGKKALAELKEPKKNDNNKDRGQGRNTDRESKNQESSMSD